MSARFWELKGMDVDILQLAPSQKILEKTIFASLPWTLHITTYPRN
jgi:hypothetical protein